MEVLLVSARGVGLSCMYLFLHKAIRYVYQIVAMFSIINVLLNPEQTKLMLILISACRSVGWRHGLQALTGVVFSTFILGRNFNLVKNQRKIIVKTKT